MDEDGKDTLKKIILLCAGAILYPTIHEFLHVLGAILVNVNVSGIIISFTWGNTFTFPNTVTSSLVINSFPYLWFLLFGFILISFKRTTALCFVFLGLAVNVFAFVQQPDWDAIRATGSPWVLPLAFLVTDGSLFILFAWCKLTWDGSKK